MFNSVPYKVGYQNPPLEGRFSTTKQPRERKVPRVRGHNVVAHVMRVLDEEVRSTSNGKSQKRDLGEILARRLVTQAMKGSVNEQLKLTKFIQESGEFDLDKVTKEIEGKYAGQLQEEQERFSALLDQHTEILAIARTAIDSSKRFARAFQAVQVKFGYEAFDADPELDQLIQEWASDQAVEESADASPGSEPGWAPTTNIAVDCVTDGGNLAEGQSCHHAGSSPGQEIDQSETAPFDGLAAGKIGSG